MGGTTTKRERERERERQREKQRERKKERERKREGEGGVRVIGVERGERKTAINFSFLIYSWIS